MTKRVPPILASLQKFINLATLDIKYGQWGVGPFVGLVLSGDNNLIDAAALGVMFGYRPKNEKQSLNIGIGALVTPSAQVLGDGIEANQPLPAGETEIRYKKVTKKYVLSIAVSFGF